MINDQTLKMQHYRYKLNDNAYKFYKMDGKTNNFTACIENYMLSSGKWLISKSKIEKLDHLIRTQDNPDGIIDCHIFIPATGQLIKDFGEKDKKRYKSVYSIEDLMIMDRKDLEGICYKFGIPYKNRTSKVLIKDILYKSSENKSKRKTKEI